MNTKNNQKNDWYFDTNCTLVQTLMLSYSTSEIRKVFCDFNLRVLVFDHHSILLKDIRGKAHEIFYVAYGYCNGYFRNIETISEQPYSNITRSCFLGEPQLIKSDKPVGIVKRYISAVIMTLIRPEIIWLATGEGDKYDCCFLFDRMLEILNSRKVTFFPDLGEYDMYVKVANVLKKDGLDVHVDTLLEDNMKKIKHKYPFVFDISDYLLEDKYNDLLTIKNTTL